MKKIKLFSVLSLSFLLSFMVLTSCQELNNGSSFKEKLEEEIEWASVKNPLKVSYISPEYSSAGEAFDSNIEIVFNQSINPLSFSFSLTDENGNDLKPNYQDPVFTKKNTTVVISPDKNNSIQLSTGDLLDVRLTLSKNIQTQDKVKLSREDVSYKIRLNSLYDDLPPVLKSVSLIKKPFEDSEETLLSTLDFAEWESSDENKKTFYQNHVGSFYINADVKDVGAGAAYLRVSEELINDSEGSKPFAQDIIEYDLPLTFNRDSEDSTLYHGTVKYRFLTDADGLIKLTFSALDYNKNKSEDSVVYYVIKDTYISSKDFGLNTVIPFEYNSELAAYVLNQNLLDTVTWSAEDSELEDNWYPEFTSTKDEIRFGLSWGTSPDNITGNSKNWSRTETAEGNEYTGKVKVEDKTADNYVRISAYDSVGNEYSETVIIPGTPTAFDGYECGEWDGVRYENYKPKFVMKSSEKITNQVIFYAEKEDETSNPLYFEKKEWVKDFGFPEFDKGKEYLCYFYGVVLETNCISFLGDSFILCDKLTSEEIEALYGETAKNNFPDLNYSYEFNNDGVNSGTHTLKITLDTKNLTEDQIAQVGLHAILTNGNALESYLALPVYFKEKDGKYIAEKKFETSFDNNQKYMFAVSSVNFTEDLNDRKVTLETFYGNNKEDNIPPAAHIEIDAKGRLELSASDKESGVVEDNEGRSIITLYYAQNLPVEDDLQNCNQLEYFFDPENPYLPLYKLGYGIFYVRLRVEDKNGNWYLSENQKIKINNYMDVIEVSIPEYVDKIYYYIHPFTQYKYHTPALEMKYSLSKYLSNISANRLYTYIEFYENGNWKQARSNDSWNTVRDLRYDNARYLITSDNKSYDSGLFNARYIDGTFFEACGYLKPEIENNYIKILFRDDEDKNYSAPRYVYADTTNSVTENIKLKDIYGKNVLCDQPTLVNVIYAEHSLGEKLDDWERLGINCSCEVITSTTTVDTSMVPNGMNYVITAHFPDNTSIMSSVMKK